MMLSSMKMGTLNGENRMKNKPEQKVPVIRTAIFMIVFTIFKPLIVHETQSLVMLIICMAFSQFLAVSIIREFVIVFEYIVKTIKGGHKNV